MLDGYIIEHFGALGWLLWIVGPTILSFVLFVALVLGWGIYSLVQRCLGWHRLE
jgi:hypothetical protein